MSEARGELRCFHCGGPLAPGGCHAVSVAGVARAVCCAGCEAAAALIAAQGLGRFYEFRDTAAEGAAAEAVDAVAPAPPPNANTGYTSILWTF